MLVSGLPFYLIMLATRGSASAISIHVEVGFSRKKLITSGTSLRFPCRGFVPIYGRQL